MKLFLRIFLTLSTVVDIRRFKSVTVALYLGITAIGLAVVWGPGSELQAATITVTSNNDSGAGSLRQALIDAAPTDTIDFSVTGTIILTSGELTIVKDITINGPGAASLTISGNDSSRVFSIGETFVVAISDLTISDGNPGGPGGGILNEGTLTLLNVTVSGNTGGGGGGISNRTTGTLTLFNVTVSGNTAGDAGGIFNRGIATLTNSTVSENFATDSGGIINRNDASRLTLINVTVADNIGDDAAGITGTLTLKNTIIANNLDVDGEPLNCQVALTSNGHNLDSDGTCGLVGTGDLTEIDPNIGPLTDNGGPTETNALLTGSPAIDAVPVADCTDDLGNPLIIDQRGFTRPVDGDGDTVVACDIGAFEFGATGMVTKLEKEIISGPDVDFNNEIDLAVEVGQFQTTQYDFEVSYSNPGGPPVLIEDTVPAEWNVMLMDDDGGNATAAPAGKGAPNKSATKIVWEPAPSGGTIKVWAETRQRPGRNVNFAPTSCGVLYLNEDGAAAFEIDPTTGGPFVDMLGDRLPPILESNKLCLTAVSDVNGGGIVPDGSGDEDGDGLSDLTEACDVGTDPCVADTDGDGVLDGVDACPLDKAVIDIDGDGCEDPQSDGTVREVGGTFLPVNYVLCGDGSPGQCTAQTAKDSCTSIGQKIVSHASNGTSEVASLNATSSCFWSVSYFTTNQTKSSDSCLVGVSNLEWSQCCTTTRWHGNTLDFAPAGQTFGVVQSFNSGFVASNPNVEGQRWGCNSVGVPAQNIAGCAKQYVACTP